MQRSQNGILNLIPPSTNIRPNRLDTDTMTSLPSSENSQLGFFHRHDFLIRRLHSLSGIVPVGAYMVVHLFTNASILGGPGAFQRNVNMIHNLGPALPFVEWTFIFLPIIFHAVVGVWIATTGKSNVSQYRTLANRRYTWQRMTGYIAFLFIFIHVFHLHGWFHFDWWIKTIAEPLGMARFRAYNASSTLALALTGYVWPVFYAIGVLSCVFHFANGLWTAGITWGLWIHPKAQQRASRICSVIGVVIAVIGLSALWGAKNTDVQEAQRIERSMFEDRLRSKEIQDDPHKRVDAEFMEVKLD